MGMLVCGNGWQPKAAWPRAPEEGATRFRTAGSLGLLGKAVPHASSRSYYL